MYYLQRTHYIQRIQNYTTGELMNKEQSKREPISFRTERSLISKLEEIAAKEHRTKSLQAEMVLKAGMKVLYPEQDSQQAA